MASPRPELSLALLAFNEVGSLEEAARRCSAVLERHVPDHELVLVDDGSTDGTHALAERLARELPRCRVIHHPRNLGIGAGIRTCYFGTRGEWATWLPADLQADPDELPRLLQELPGCDVLITYRDPHRRQGGWPRRLVSASDRALTRLLFGLKLRDLHWVRFFRRPILERMRLTCRSPLADTEMVLQARRLGARIREAPLDERPRREGRASGASFRHLRSSLVDLAALRLRGIHVAAPGERGTLPAHEDPSWLAGGPAAT